MAWIALCEKCGKAKGYTQSHEIKDHWEAKGAKTKQVNEQECIVSWCNEDVFHG